MHKALNDSNKGTVLLERESADDKSKSLEETEISEENTMKNNTLLTVKFEQLPSGSVRGDNIRLSNGNEDDYGEIDPLGERKVDKYGNLLGGRQYAVKTFTLPRNPQKRWMLSRDPAVLLGLRDSFVLFLRNPMLKRETATETDKSYLLEQNLLPNTLKKRDVLIVSARSIFKRFGHRVISKGKPREDDYYESSMDKHEYDGMTNTETVTVTSNTHMQNTQGNSRESDYISFDTASAIPRLGALKYEDTKKNREEEAKVMNRIDGIYQMALTAQRFNREMKLVRNYRGNKFYDRHTGLDLKPSPRAHKRKYQQESEMNNKEIDLYPIVLIDGQRSETWPWEMPEKKVRKKMTSENIDDPNDSCMTMMLRYSFRNWHKPSKQLFTVPPLAPPTTHFGLKAKNHSINSATNATNRIKIVSKNEPDNISTSPPK